MTKNKYKTFTKKHHIQHFWNAFNSGELFYFEDILCYCNYVNSVENEVRVLAVNPYSKKFVPFEIVKLNTTA